MAKTQAAMFEDTIGELVDQYIRDGMSPDLIEKTLRYQADYVQPRAAELKEQA